MSPLVERQLDETRHEIDRADGKASIMLSLVSLVAAGIVGAILGGQIEFSELEAATKGAVVVSVVCLAASLGFLGHAVYPRLGAPVAGRADYFHDHAQYDGPEDLEEALAATGHSHRNIRQLHALAGVCLAKYKNLQRGTLAAAAALILAGAGALLHVS